MKPHPLATVIRQLLLGTGFGLATHVAIAQPGSDRGTEGPVEEILVTEAASEGYRVEDNSLSKLTESIRDTPQSITTLSRELMDDRGATSLNDALRNVPGVTLGAGEFSWQGNNPTIRGFSSRDDMYLDGLRDFGSYPRDPFNLETVEVLLGPSSLLFGRGSTGGAINQASKLPRLEHSTDLSVNVGSDQTFRATADLSRPLALLGDGAALRLNLLAHDGEVTDRYGAESERFGIAPTLALGLDGDTQVILGYMKQTSDDRPDYGLPWLNGQPVAVPRDRYYGFDSDYLNTDADILSTQVLHAVSDTIRLNAQVRYAEYDRENRITEPLITPVPPAGTPLDQISVYRYVFAGESEETLLTSQVTATLELGTGRVRHALVTGAEFSRETSAPLFAFGNGVPSTNLVNPTPQEPFSATSLDPRIIADTESTTAALFLIDTMKFGESWQVILGARFDRFDTSYTADRFAGPPTPFNSGTASGHEEFSQVDDVTSYRAAVVYKPVESASIYLAGSTAFNPSAQSLSFLTTGRSLGTENVGLDPEENRSLELGVKKDLNGDTLSLSSAIFEITKTNARVPDPSNPGFNTLGGEQRMRGLSVDVTGRVTQKLYLASGYSYLDGEVVRSAPGAATGAKLANAPEHSVSVWADYHLTNLFDLGLGARYVSEQVAQNTGAGRRTPSYTVFDAMVRYRLSNTVALKLNLANLTDELYFEQLHAWHVVPGPGFTATLAVNTTF